MIQPSEGNQSTKTIEIATQAKEVNFGQETEGYTVEVSLLYVLLILQGVYGDDLRSYQKTKPFPCISC